MRAFWLGLVALLVASGSHAQGTIQQSGPIVPFHSPAWFGNGIVADAGTPQAPFLDSIGLFGGASCPFGVSSQTGPGMSLTAYSQLSICQTLTATTFNFNGLNGQANPSVFFNIGGVTYPFPGPGNGNVLGPGTAISGDLACFNGVTGTLLSDCGPPAASINAAAQAGSNAGAKIAAAIAKLPAGGGTIDATGLIGTQTISTAIVIPANTFVQFPCGAVYTQSAIITLSGISSAIRGCPTGIGVGNAQGSTRFIEASGANLSQMVLVAGSQAYVGFLILDGNKSNNAANPNLNITADHFYIDSVTSQNSAGAGIAITSTGTSDQACCGSFQNVAAMFNAGDGVYCTGTTDTFIALSSFENNSGGSGLELNNCAGTRISTYDFGGNAIGLWVHGAAFSPGVSEGSNNQIIGIGQFGNNAAQDILLDGSSGGTYGNTITGANFIGSSTRTSNTYASIEIANNGTGGNVISGVGITSTPSHTFSSAIYIHGSEGPDTVSNVRTLNPFGAATFNIPTNTALDEGCDTNAGTCLTTFGNYLKPTFIGNASGYAATAQTAGANAADQFALDLQNPSGAAFTTVTEDWRAGANVIGRTFAQQNNTGLGGSFIISTSNSGGAVTSGFQLDQNQNVSLLGAAYAGCSSLTTSGAGQILCAPVITGITAGAAAQIGTGGTTVCAALHVCDSYSGEVTIAAGTGSPTAGTLFTVNFSNARTNKPNCVVQISGGVTFLAPSQTETTTTLAVAVGVGLTASTNYTVDYHCGGV